VGLKLDDRLADDTIVVWSSDNGPPRSTTPRRSTDPVGGYGQDSPGCGGRPLHLSRVKQTPASSAGRKVPAGRSNEIVHVVDWYPTLLNAAGVKVPDDRIIDGMDMRDFLLGDAESGRDTVLHFQEEPAAGDRGTSGSVTRSSRTTSARPGCGNMPQLHNLD
jgi:arylsulfatase